MKTGRRYEDFGTAAKRQMEGVEVVLWSKVWTGTSVSQSVKLQCRWRPVRPWQLWLWEPVFWQELWNWHLEEKAVWKTWTSALTKSQSTHKPQTVKMIKDNRMTTRFCSSGRSWARAKLGGIRFLQLGFSVARPERMFSQCFQHRWLEAKCVVCLPPVKTNGWTTFDEKAGPMWPQKGVLGVEDKTTREKLLVQFWMSCVRDEFDLANSIQTKAAFSSAMAVMDRVGGWRFQNEEGSRLGSKIRGVFMVILQGGCLQWPDAHGNIQRQTKRTQSWKTPVGFVHAVKTTTSRSLNSPW